MAPYLYAPSSPFGAGEATPSEHAQGVAAISPLAGRSRLRSLGSFVGDCGRSYRELEAIHLINQSINLSSFSSWDLACSIAPSACAEPTAFARDVVATLFSPASTAARALPD